MVEVERREVSYTQQLYDELGRANVLQIMRTLTISYEKNELKFHSINATVLVTQEKQWFRFRFFYGGKEVPESSLKKVRNFTIDMKELAPIKKVHGESERMYFVILLLEAKRYINNHGVQGVLEGIWRSEIITRIMEDVF